MMSTSFDGRRKRVAYWLLFTVIAPLLLTALGCQEQGFACGVALESQPEVITTCGRSLEVCVCEVRRCAQKVATTECASGLRYVEAPFVEPERAGQCVVELLYPSWTVVADSQSERRPLCSTVAPNTDMSVADGMN